MDKKKKAPIEIPHKSIPEVQTDDGRTEQNTLYCKKEIAEHPENYYGGPTKTDVLGSYTGQPTDKYDTPVQDADDL